MYLLVLDKKLECKEKLARFGVFGTNAVVFFLARNVR